MPRPCLTVAVIAKVVFTGSGFDSSFFSQAAVLTDEVHKSHFYGEIFFIQNSCVSRNSGQTKF